MDEIVSIIDNHIINNEGTFHLTGVNPETISRAQQVPALKAAINSSDLVSVDNMLVATALRLMGYRVPERLAGPDVFEKLLALAASKKYSVYFLGAREEILQLMLKKIKMAFPGIIVAGSRNGYYASEEEPAIVNDIAALKPDMLFVALPSPNKEVFIYNHKLNLGARFAFGVGGAFDCMAGKVRRAPLWMRKIGLEGIHRNLQNPSDYGRRYVKYLFLFMKLVLKDLSFKKRRSAI